MPILKILRNILVEGEHHAEGSLAEFSNDIAEKLIRLGKAKTASAEDAELLEGLQKQENGTFTADKTVVGLGQVLGLGVREVLKLLADDYELKLKKGPDPVETEIFNKVVEDHTVSVADLAETLGKTVSETLEILDENGAGIEGNVDARVAKDLVEEILKEFIQS